MSLHIEWMAVHDLYARQEPRNSRQHDLDAIKLSFRKSGFVAPPLLNEHTGRLVWGHGRVRALVEMSDDQERAPERVRIDEAGEWWIPVLRGLAFDTTEDALRYLVADNRTAELAHWDLPDLGGLLSDLRDRERLVGTGYTNDDLEALLADVQASLRGVGDGGGDVEPNSRLKQFTFQVTEADYDAVNAAIDHYVEQHGVSKNDAFVALCLSNE